MDTLPKEATKQAIYEFLGTKQSVGRSSERPISVIQDAARDAIKEFMKANKKEIIDAIAKATINNA
jgi:predicted thioredoxin/glutaredoxin